MGRSAAEELAQGRELLVGGRRSPVQIGGDGELPAGGLANLVDLDAGMDLDEGQLPGVGVGLQDPEVGDDRGGAAAAEAEALAVAGPVAEADRGAEVQAVHE